MAQVEVIPSLYEEIRKKFKHQSVEVLEHLKSLESSPHKGKLLGNVSGIVIKELKYEGFRFYFVTDGFKLQCYDQEKLVNLLLRFVRMSDKNQQQQTIKEIKHVLRTIGAGGFQ